MRSILFRCFFIICVFYCIPRCNSQRKDSHYLSNLSDDYTIKYIDSLIYFNTDSAFISIADDFCLFKNRILISDYHQKKVFVFDKSFQFIESFGGEGRGPGEYTIAPRNIGYFDTLWTRSRNISDWYDENFNFIKREILPAKYIYAYSEIILEDKIILSVGFPFPISKTEYFEKFNSVLAIERATNSITEFCEWDEDYFKPELSAYTKGNPYVSLAKKNLGYFFVLQLGTYRIRLFDNDLNLAMIFGRPLKYFKQPPQISFKEIQRNMETIIDYETKKTTIQTLKYDESTENLFVYYVNFNREYFYTKSKLSGDHYLQVYNKNYDVIADIKVDGRLAFVNDGKIYIHTDETPKYIKIKIYKLTKRGIISQ